MPKYDEYLASEEWWVVRNAAVGRAGGRCQVCNQKEQLNVHHRTYDNIYHEKPDDLVVLCRTCHALFHAPQIEKKKETRPPARKIAPGLRKKPAPQAPQAPDLVVVLEQRSEKGGKKPVAVLSKWMCSRSDWKNFREELKLSSKPLNAMRQYVKSHSQSGGITSSEEGSLGWLWSEAVQAHRKTTGKAKKKKRGRRGK